MHFNWIFIVGSAIIPLLTGFVWYHPKVMGNAWMVEAGMTEDKIKNSNMGLIFGMTLLMGVLLSFIILSLVIHQVHYYSILADNKDMADPNSSISQATKAFMDVNGMNFRTFKHGVLHGTIAGLFFATPVVTINALFERKSRKYILIHVGYWIITLALMGGVICAFA